MDRVKKQREKIPRLFQWKFKKDDLMEQVRQFKNCCVEIIKYQQIYFMLSLNLPCKLNNIKGNVFCDVVSSFGTDYSVVDFLNRPTK